MALPQFQNLHKWLEVDYNPLLLCKNVEEVIEYIRSDEKNPLMQYIDALHDVTLVRLVRQVSQVYQTIEFTRLLELAKFADTFKLERTLVDCVRHNDMQITIDHKDKMVMFGTDLSESQREDHHDGPTLQSMPSEQVRQQLVNMSIVLHRAIKAINPNRQKAEHEAMRAQMVALYHENKVREHNAILIRQKLIEDRKEHIERLNTEREEEEVRRQEEILQHQKLAEKKRLELEAEEKKKKKEDNEKEQIRNRAIQEAIQKLAGSAHGQKIIKNLEEKGTPADPDELAKEETQALARENKELKTKLKSQEKRVDYFERAKRIEEVPLIKDYLKEMVVKEEVFWQTQEKTRIENAIAERKNAVAQQERLKRIYADRDAYMNQLKAERKNLYLEKLKNFNEALEEERKKRLHQRVAERRKERRDKWLAEREAEKQRKLDEQRKEKEEIQRLENERRKVERDAELEKLNAQSEKQRQKDAEIEKKMEEQKASREAAYKVPRESDDRGQWRNAGAKDSGRDTGRENEGAWRRGDAEPVSAWRRDNDKQDDQGGFRRNDRSDDRGGFKKTGRDSRDSRDAPMRRVGEDSGPIRRSGDDSAPIRRSGAEDSRDTSFRRGGDFKRSDDRGGKRFEDRGPQIRRGDDRSGPPRRGADDSTNWRTRDQPPRESSDRPKEEGSSWRTVDKN